MSQKSILCCTDHPEIYPSYGDADFDPASHAVAEGHFCVPRLWLALFGPDSLVTQSFEVVGNEHVRIRGDGSVQVLQVDKYQVPITAPLASRELCLERLPENVLRLETLLDLKMNTLAPHSHFLKRALEARGGEFLTVELQEMIGSRNRDRFYEDLLIVLRWFEGSDEPRARQACRALGDLDLSRPIGPPRGLEHPGDLADSDARNQENLLGCGYHGAHSGRA